MTEQLTMAIEAPSSEGADRSRHHPYGPSRWPALLECPAHESDHADGDANATRGTELHALFERAMRGEDAQSRDAVEYHVVQFAEGLRRTETPDARGFMAERTVTVPFTDGIFGRLDLAWVDANNGDIHVADLKMASNPDRDHLPQLMAYAAAIVAEVWDGNGRGPAVWLHALYAVEGDAEVVRLDADALMTAHQRNADRIAAIMAGRGDMAPRQSGWCQFCARKDSCAAFRAIAESVTKQGMAEVAEPATWAAFSPARKAQLCALAEAAAKWAEGVKARAAEDARNGLPIEDPDNGIYYKPQERKGRLELETNATWEAVKERLGKDWAENYRACLNVNTSALKAALKASGMKAKEVDALLEEAGTRGPSTVVLVRAKKGA